MNFETLKKDNKKKYMIGLIVISVMVVTLTYIGTRAKYRVTNSTQLASGVINYSPSDLEIVAIKIQNDSNGYDNSDTVPTNGYTLNTEKSICKVGENKQDVTIAYENGKIAINGITAKGTKCHLYFDKSSSKDLILSKNTIDNSKSSGYFPTAFTDDTARKIFNAEDDDGTTYFFAGSNPNNWVQFGGFYWRIIRINGDGSIRLIYNGPTTAQTGTSTQIGESAFNESYDDNAYVGFMYGTVGSSTYEETHANINSSTIKIYLDNWYTTNLKENYEKYIDKMSGFCGDRTVDNYDSWATGDGSGTTQTEYAPSKRLENTNIATYKCSNSNDYYTVSTSNKGNKALENPIGLITADEVLYAGGYKAVSDTTYNYWLNTGQYYWTMSPHFFGVASARKSYSFIYVLNEIGGIHSYEYGVSVSYGVRPVISLKSDTLTLGSGTTTDPYRMS